MKMKKLIALLLAVVMVLSLAACGAKEETTATTAAAEATAAATEAAEIDPVAAEAEIRYAIGLLFTVTTSSRTSPRAARSPLPPSSLWV